MATGGDASSPQEPSRQRRRMRRYSFWTRTWARCGLAMGSTAHARPRARGSASPIAKAPAREE